MIDGILIKKMLSMFVHLIPGVLILLLVFLLLRKWLPRCSYYGSALCVVILFVSSLPFVSDNIVSRLENQYPVVEQLPSDTGLILVLGYGHSYQPERPINSILNPVALSRLSEAVRLWKTKPTIPLIVSGAPSLNATPGHAELMEKMALELQVPQTHIVRFDNSLDTEDEIVSAVKLLSEATGTDRRLVVVSSAIHLPRAAMLLDQHNAFYTLAPAEFIVDTRGSYLPGGHSLYNTDRAVHELVGMLWYRLRNLF